MKKSILILCAVFATFGFTAFGYMNWTHTATAQEETSSSSSVVFDDGLFNPDYLYKLAEVDLFYDVAPRFMATISKEDLHNAKSIIDIVPEEATQSLASYQAVKVSVLHEDEGIRENRATSEKGDSEVLNAAQLRLLQSADYSTNIYIAAICKNKNTDTWALEDYELVYYITVTPEKEAEYTEGHDALIAYLKENSKKETLIIQKDQLKPGMVSFAVTKEGTISNVKLSSTSGYPSVDEKLIELISNMSGKWNPATNSKGEKVDQELVFFFGMRGC